MERRDHQNTHIYSFNTNIFKSTINIYTNYNVKFKNKENKHLICNAFHCIEIISNRE